LDAQTIWAPPLIENIFLGKVKGGKGKGSKVKGQR